MIKPRLLALPLLAAALLAPAACAQNDDDDEHGSKPVASRSAPSTTEAQAAAAFSLKLSPPRQQQSGLKTHALAAFALGLESPAYGKVLDISPLLELRARHRAAQAELAIAEAALQVAQKSRERLAKLHGEAIVPARELIQAEAQLASDLARREAAARHLAEIREEALQHFGGELTRQALEKPSPVFEELLNRSRVLALIALPSGQALPKAVQIIHVAPDGDRGKAKTARLLSAAPKTEESTQGETWYFLADPAGLRSGMRLDAWIPHTGQASSGVLIPAAAIVWRDGQPWVFVQTGADSFARRPVGAHRVQGEDWFVATGFSPGEEAVVVGGQMLLSEEQRRGTPQDGDDD